MPARRAHLPRRRSAPLPRGLALPAAAAAAGRRSPTPTSTCGWRQDAALLVDEKPDVRVRRATSQASYRDIPLRAGRERSTTSSSRRAARVYRSGGCTVFGCTDAAGHLRRRRTRAERASGSSGTTRRATRPAPSPSATASTGRRRRLRRRPRRLLAGLGRPVGLRARPPRRRRFTDPALEPGADDRRRSRRRSGATRATSRARPPASRASPCSRPTTSTTTSSSRCGCSFRAHPRA